MNSPKKPTARNLVLSNSIIDVLNIIANKLKEAGYLTEIAQISRTPFNTLLQTGRIGNIHISSTPVGECVIGGSIQYLGSEILVSKLTEMNGTSLWEPIGEPILCMGPLTNAIKNSLSTRPDNLGIKDDGTLIEEKNKLFLMPEIEE